MFSIVADADNSAVCDLAEGFGFGWVTPRVVENQGYLRYFFIEAMGYVMLASRYLAPVHAACVTYEGAGLLLCGDSGAGKSSLAYACARRGWTYVCDDASHMVRKAEDATFVGNGYELRFRPEARGLFDELRPMLARKRENGKLTIEVPTHQLPGIRMATRARARRMLFLERRRGAPPSITPLPREKALERLERWVCYGPAWMRTAWVRSYRKLVRICPAYEFTYWGLGAAIDRLEGLVERGR
jgi:hypothetical protein